MQVAVFGEIGVDYIHLVRDSRDSLRWLIDETETQIGGMGANVAVILYLLGQDVTFATSFDENYAHLTQKLRNFGLSCVSVAEGSLTQFQNFRFLNEPHLVGAFRRGEILRTADLTRVSQRSFDIIVVTPIALQAAMEIPADFSAPVTVLAPALEYQELDPVSFEALLQGYDILVLDRSEAMAYTRLPEEEAIEWFRQRPGLCTVITKAEQGSMALHRNQVWQEEAYSTESLQVVDTMGCGDGFAAAFALAYAESHGDIQLSLDFAARCATLVASVPSMWEGMVEAAESDSFRKQWKALLGRPMR